MNSPSPDLQALALPTVRDAFYHFMREVGCRQIFGNPGSTELPMVRNFPDDFKYVLGLQEACVIGMADGYAQASHNATFVNLHSAAGVGNAMGNIYTAFKNQTPLVIVAGQQSRSIQPFDPYLHSRRAAELPHPYVKWSIEPARAEDVPLAIRKAYHIAMQQPRGPVLVSVPADDWDKACHPLMPAQVSQVVAPDPAQIQMLCGLIQESRRIALVVGAAIDREGAWPEVVQLAQACHAAVFAAPMASRGSFPESHSLFQGFLPASSAAIRELLYGHDLVLVVGGPAFTYHVERDTEGSHLPEGATLAVLTDDAEAAASVPQGFAVQGSVRLGLQGLLRGLVERPAIEPPKVPRRPVPAVAEGTDPISVAFVLQTLSKLRDPRDIVVEEAPTARVVMHQYLRIDEPGTFYTMASGGLGYGMPAAVGIAMAQPDRRVICVIGDGSSMYSIQSLWTAAEQGANVVFVVLNNRRYAALKRFSGVLGFAAGEKLVGIDIPGIDFSGLAKSQGCFGEKVDEWGQVEAALSAALQRQGPTVLDVAVA
ncbi:benzoylformate decarboxylase [Variovorax sp. J22P271]|uniref:benzoylformate decarboxylase n=1 Tax=Variovorax davisae TaxID=3053515 RepID=UPI0025780828|nr:benzoylformate decarboxylase [Variovorax sp. J22P271]MDM0032032.1 benzoylformate decarboxylase [Variovorax sp. J22P271]